MPAAAGPEVKDRTGQELESDVRAAGPAVAEAPAGSLLRRREARFLGAQRSAGNRAVAGVIQAARVQRKPIDQLPAEPAPAPIPPAPTQWLGREVDSDLPRDAEGKVAAPKAAIGRGIPKMNSRDVNTGDAVMKQGVGVGNMFTPIKRGVMRPVGKPGAGTSESIVMVDTLTGRKYLFKPIGGEPTVDYAEARGVDAGHFAERARAGSVAAGALGVDTPDVRLVSINGRKGSLTAWVEPKAGGEVMSLATYAKQDEQRFKALQDTRPFQEALSGVQALDYLINNVDRVNNLGNYMIELDENKQFKALIPIDQELSFTGTGDRAIIHGRTSLMPTQWTKTLADKVARLHADPRAFIAQIRPLVGDQAVAGVVARLGQLHADGVRRGFIPRPPGTPGGPGGAGTSGGAGTGGSGRGGTQPPLAPGGETPAADDEPLVRGGRTAGSGSPLAGSNATSGTGPGSGQREGTRPPVPRSRADPASTPGPDAGGPAGTPDAGAATDTPDVPRMSSLGPPGVLGDINDVPVTNMTAEQLGIVPGSRDDNARFRANRAEQLRLAGLHASDLATVRAATVPDARARARAADYASIYSGWDALGPDGRKARIEKIINAHLAREGIPPVKATYGTQEPGHAVFSAKFWAISLSGKAVDGPKPTIEEFADLVDSAVHETQHTVTTYRGVRVALANEQYDEDTEVKVDIVAQARAANDRRLPSAELNEHALGEAEEIYRLQLDPKRSNATVVGPGEVSRVAVTDEKTEASFAYRARVKDFLDLNDEIARNPDDPELVRRAEVARQAALVAQERYTRAHNAYMALAEETVSWRAGSAVNTAVAERLTLEEDLRNAQRRAEIAEAEHKALRGKGRLFDERAAKRRGQEERQLIAQLQTRFDQLTTAEARIVDGRPAFRDVPLSQGEIERAPRPQHRVGEEFDDDAGPNASRAVRSTPGPGGEIGPVRTAAPGTKPPSPTPVDEPDEAVAPRWADDPKNLKREWAKTRTTRVPRGETKKTTTKALSAGTEAPKAELRRRVEETADDGTTKAKETSGAASFNLQQGAVVDLKRKVESPAPSGQDAPKPGSEVAAKAYVNPNQAGGELSAMKNTKGGGQHGAVAGATYDWKSGDTTSSTGYKGQTKGGSSANFALTSGNSVRAEEPEEISDGVWEVRFTWTDNDGVAAGVTGKMPGGMELSIGGSDTDSKTKTGSKRFPTEKQALEFKKNVRAELGKEIAAAKFLPPINTVAGALRIPEGETRGYGAANTKSGNVAAGFASGSLGKSGYKMSGYSMDIQRVAGTTVRVTLLVTTGKGSAWTASGLGLTNESGGSESGAVGVTYEFNLGNKAEGAAYERYLAFPLPAPAGKKPYSTRRMSSEEEHDNYALLWGTAGFGGEVSEDITNDAQGEHARFTGAQTEDVNPGLIMGLFDDEKHARAEIVSSAENGKAVGFAAKMSVSGESGEFNRRQFGKIFMGASYSGEAKASGKWTLTAAIPKESVRQLQDLSSAFKNAKTTYEKLRIYSQLVKQNGAQMLGGQVGITSLAWNLELKGDSNFPGEKGRARLNAQRAELIDRLAKKPGDAFTIAREAKETLDALDVRYRGVKDETKYTDLPDGLRKEQLEVIRGHMREFIFVRQRALGVGNQRDPNETLGDVEKRAYAKDGYNQVPTNERERAQLQDGIRLANRDVIQRFNQVYNASLAIKGVMPTWGAFNFSPDADPALMPSVTNSAMDDIKAAFEFEHQQQALESQVKILWERWDREPDPAKKLEAMKPLLAKLRERLGVLTLELERLKAAGKTLYPLMSFPRMQKRPKFWVSVSEAREEAPDEVPMALPR